MVLAAVCALAGCGDDADLPAIGPRISFEKTSHDFGVITDTDKQFTSFPFTNTGNDILVISDVKAACGCTVPTLERTRFLPGEGDQIKVTFDPRGKHGRTEKQISVVSNSKPEGLTKLMLNSDIKPMLQLDTFHRLGVIPLGEENKSLMPFTYADPDLRISDVQVNNPSITARVAAMGMFEGDDPGASHLGTIEVTVSPDAPWGTLYATRLTFKATGRPTPDHDPVEHEYTVFIQGQIHGEVAGFPSIISLGTLGAGQPYEGAMTLGRNSGGSLNVLDARVIESTMPGVQVRLDPQGPDVSLVVYGSTGSFHGPIRGVVALTTDVPGEEELEVRYAGSVK